MEKQILHVDVNNAFLSWLAVYRLENGEQTDIRKIPAIIGGDEKQRHGIVLAKSNLAKQIRNKNRRTNLQCKKKMSNITSFFRKF